MLQSLGWAALGTGFTFLMTALGAAMVFFFAGEPRPRFQKALLGFAAGVMTAASVWSLLLPAIDRAAEGALPDWLPAAGGMLLGVVFLSALDALLPHLRRDRTWQDASWRQTTLLMTAITLHNVPEGMAVGLAFALAAGGETAPHLRAAGAFVAEHSIIRTIAAGTNCMTATVYVDTVAIGRGCGNSIVDFLADGTKSDIITEYTLIDGSNAAEYVTEAE